MKISLRLKAIGDFIHEKAHVIDIGADHGLLEKYLLEQQKIASIVAVENKDGPYKILCRSLKGYNVRTSLSDGLDDMDDNVDTIVIAGMGGNLIMDILTKDVQKLNGIEQIVVDAHRDGELVRREVTKLGYRIEKEKIVAENGIFYFIISFVKGQTTYKDIEYEWGLNVNKDPLFQQFKAKELDRLGISLVQQKKAKIASPTGIKRLQSKIERLETL